MQTYAGVAPVIERSGKHCWAHWRWNCPKFLKKRIFQTHAALNNDAHPADNANGSWVDVGS